MTDVGKRWQVAAELAHDAILAALHQQMMVTVRS